MVMPALESETTLLRPLTYDDLAAMPDDGKRYELINGELYEMPGATPKHQRSVVRLATRLERLVEASDLGQVFVAPVDVKFSAHFTFQPDVFFVPWSKESIVLETLVEGVPDLIIEVLSKNRGHDFITKAAVYATFGVLEYWIVDPAQLQIYVKELRGSVYAPIDSSDGIARSKVIPGFAVDPAELFADSRPTAPVAEPPR